MPPPKKKKLTFSKNTQNKMITDHNPQKNDRKELTVEKDL